MKSFHSSSDAPHARDRIVVEVDILKDKVGPLHNPPRKPSVTRCFSSGV